MKIVTLSGWGQSHDALSALFPDARHVDYAGCDNPMDAMAIIATEAAHADAIIGWSLGGQLAVRAVAAGLMQPRKLVLLATPFQFVESAQKKLGMKRDQFEKFCGNYASNSARTLGKLWELIVKGDAQAKSIKAHRLYYKLAHMQTKPWHVWLDYLDQFSCQSLNFGGFPPLLLLHGQNDVVVKPTQSHEFARHIPHAKTIILPDCGHAPHWHDTALVRRHIEEFLHV